MFDLLSKEKIYGIDTVSSCFVIDVEIRDFINSVRAEIFDCVEFDIAFKVLLQLCAYYNKFWLEAQHPAGLPFRLMPKLQ